VDELVAEVERLETIVSGWNASDAAIAHAYRAAVDDLNAEAFRRFIIALRAEPGALPALRTAVQDELVYAVLRRYRLIKPSLQERVEAALDTVRPMLAMHGGDVQLVRVVPPSAIDVRFTGACESCPASVTTFTLGVKKALEEGAPEITDVRQVKGLASGAVATGSVRFVSPFAANETDRWLPAGTVGDIPEDGIRATTIGGEPVLLWRSGDALACVQNACAHQGFPIDRGIVADGTIVCPRHGFTYELASGECLTAPGVQLRMHAVRLVGDDVHVRLAR
jgi:nitrite reductase/ring-hydroxylating ferredoxin subunit/Fe-S cluster biogenesis protein NfuA